MLADNFIKMTQSTSTVVGWGLIAGATNTDPKQFEHLNYFLVRLWILCTLFRYIMLWRMTQHDKFDQKLENLKSVY